MNYEYKGFCLEHLRGQAKKMMMTVVGLLLTFVVSNAQTYCTPSGGAGNARITNFTLANVNNATPNSSNGYNNYTAVVGDTIQLQGLISYIATISSNGDSGSHGAAIWIDFNNNGSFESGEMVASIPNSIQPNSTTSFPSFTVPDSAGYHRLRVAYAYAINGSAIDPCATPYYSEASDYTVYITGAVACTGTPSAGTPPASFGRCPMDPFNITMSGVTIAGGMFYQWQQRDPAGTGTWTDMIGFNATSLSYPGGVFANDMDFRLIAKCIASNSSDTSNLVTVTVNPPSACYCVPSTRYTSYFMNGVSTSGATQDITYTQSGFPTGGYVDSMLAVQTFESKATQTFNITAGFSLNTTTKSSFRIWVDWGQDGSFDNSDLVVDDFKALGGSQTYSVTVPATASMGDYRMRVRYGYTQNPLAPCGQTNYGSTVDFKLHIGTPPSCLAPTNVAAQNITDTTADLTWTENGSATQWQVEYGTFGSIPGAGTTVITSTNPYAIVLTPSTDYEFRVRAICGAGDTSQWSAPTPFTNSYCTFPTQSTTTYYINNFETQGGLVNISNNGTGLGTNYNGYSDFTNKAVLGYPGQTITATTGMLSSSGSYGYAIFIDWNGNYIFDPSERVYSNNTYGQNPLAGTFTVPNVANGNYRMRIVADYLSTAPDACGGSSYGDAEDYTFSVVTIPTCLPVTNIIEDSVSSSSLQVSWTPGGSETSWKVEWGVPGFTPGTGTGIDSATVSSAIHLITGLTSNTDYDVYIKADCGGGDLSYWASISLTTECDIMQALGYCEVFDDASDFNCWSVIDNDGDGNSWVWDNNGNGFDGDGSVMVSTYMNAGSNDDYLVLPRMHLTGNEVLKFKYKSQYNFYTQDFDVLISTTNKQASSFTDTLLPVFTFNNDTYMDTTVDLSAYSGDVYIAFHVPVGGIDDWAFYIDNVCINICTPIAGIPGSATICSANGLVDLDSIISSQYGNGSWFLAQNQTAINGHQLDPTYLAEGTYQAKYVVYGECTNDTTIATIHISNVSSAGVGTTTTVCKNAKVDLFSLLTGNVDMGGNWLDYQQQPITGSSTTVPSLPGSYNYFYITSNGVCGTDTATVVITVDPSCDALSLSGVALDNVNVYPNPAHSVLNINNPSNLNNLRGELIDMNGRLVMDISKAMNKKTTISLENLQRGIYTLRLYNDEGQRIFKVVKE